MVDRNQRDMEHRGGRLGKIDPHKHRADQAGRVGDGDRIDLAPRDAGLLQRALREQRDGLHMAAGGDFGDDPAVDSMQIGLRENLIAEDFPPVPDHGHGCLVAGGFKSKNIHSACSYSFVISTASSFGAE